MHKVGVIAGDGIGPEVIAEALKVVAATGVAMETVDYDLGAGRYERTGEVLPDSVLEELRSLDAILLGAVGPPIGSTAVPSGVIERGLLLKLRFELDLYINLRPFKGSPGSIAAEADFLVVRENTEGPYIGEGGALRRGTAFEVATQGSVNTRHGVERCVRYAFELAEQRGRPHVTLVHKTNVLTYSGDLWRRVFDSVGADHPEVATAYNHVDAACIFFVEDAVRYEVVVTDNLFGDILSDEAGALTGSLGMLPSASLGGPVGLYEPVHGSAPDLAGRDLANPVGAIGSAALLLRHSLGLAAEADALDAAVAAALTHGFGTSDLACQPARVGTRGMGEAIRQSFAHEYCGEPA